MRSSDTVIHNTDTLQQTWISNHSVTNVSSLQLVGPTNFGVRVISPKPVLKRRLTIGIPTIKRRDKNYFMDMLGTMLNKTSEEELRDIVFVIFLADLNNTDWKSETEAAIVRNYSKYVQSGSLQVVQAPRQFYEKMHMFGNNSYLNWRTKQNYDYAYLMQYCDNLSDYYMQMEDDVIASDGYYSAILDFIAKQPDDKWICLEFSELGFIGKLYHSKHIRDLSEMLLIFSHTQPVDYTYVYFNMLLRGGPKKIRKPTLFQHMGFHSSLNEKIQPLRDKFFDFPAKEWNGDNPTAKIYTTLDLNDDFPPSLPYAKEPGHFWSYSSAKENDTYKLIFESSQSVYKIVVITGSKDHPGDIIHHGVLEASAIVSGSAEVPVCEDFITLGNLEKGKILVDSEMIRAKLGVVRIKCLQIRLTKSQVEWVIIKEIAVFLSQV